MRWNETRRKTTIVTFALLASLVSFQACGGADGFQQPRELSADEQALVAASENFGLDFFREVVSQSDGGNVFVSPLSVSMALGMTVNGARGTTEQGMRQALRIDGMTAEQANRAFRDLIGLLTTMDPAVTVEIANSIWYREGLEVLQEFVDVNVEFFNAVVQALDFASPQAAETINNWVSDATHGLIDRIIEGQIPPAIVMYLINAVYFKGDWTTKFDKSVTRPDTFHALDGDKTVQMMHLKAGFRVVEEGTFSAIELPYGHELFHMTILLPDEPTGVDDLVASLSADRWRQLMARFEAAVLEEIEVYLPKFKLEWKSELKPVLAAMGMAEAFDPNMADFTGIVPEGGLYISEVFHKSFVRVDEEGTEAAAATRVDMGLGAISPPPEFRVDRPFVFAIHDRHSGALLFIGKIVDPPPVE